ncbi:hypothetical protein [Undibacterium flavidum]|uniref:Uncharacterized protein n=1 Tax=Undibacterium flavidum TaxID=2762297 RepID=A0ABR6Y7G0_9BURK|nr:hypothetical protein [Undibacterium flavidum]MBC3872541.1 hypothetical protein [Undibacterium flavidum]
MKSTTGETTVIDGTFPQTIELKSGTKFGIPTKQRKIRRIGDAWLAVSGDFLLGQLAFDQLNQIADTSCQEMPKVWETLRGTLRQEVAYETGFPIEEIDKTVIAMVCPALETGVRILQVNPNKVAVAFPGQFVITWPPDINPTLTDALTAKFQKNLEDSFRLSSLSDIFRAILVVMDEANRLSPTVGSIIQFGLALKENNKTFSYFYSEGAIKDFSEMNSVQLEQVVLTPA